MDLQVGILQVAVVTTQNGRQRFDVSCSDGQVRGVWDASLANALNAFAGGQAQVTIRETTKPGRNPGQVYRNIVAFAPPGQQLPPDTGGTGGGAGQGGFMRGGGKGMTPEDKTRIAKMGAQGSASTLVAALFTGAGPEAYPEAVALMDDLTKKLYKDARSHEKPGAEQPDGPQVLAPGATIGAAAQPQVLQPGATAADVAATVPGVVLGAQVLQPGNAGDATAAADVTAQNAAESGDSVEWD